MPPHVLLSGRFRSLEPLFLEEVARRQEGDPLRPVEVLVGSNLLAVYLRRAALASGGGGLAGLRFLTFLDLARRMTRHADPRPVLPALGEELLARRALSGTPLASRFGPLRERASLARAVARTAADLREARTGPFELLRLAEGVARDRRERLEALSSVLSALEAERARFSDPDLLLEQAARHGEPTGDDPLLAYGLYDLGAVREALLSRLARTRPIVAFVPDDALPDDATPPVRTPLFEALLGVAARRLPDAASPVRPEVVLARDESDEARETVRELIAGLESGIPLHRSAILVRRPETQEAPIVAELNRAGIPYFRPAGPGFGSSPLGRAARLLLDAAGTGLGARSVPGLVDVLDGAGLADGISSGLVRAAFQELGPVEGSAALRRRLDRRIERHERAARRAEGDDDPRPREALRRLRSVDAALARLEPLLPSAEPAAWATWGERLRDAFSSLAGSHPDAPRLDEAAEAIGALEAVEPRGSARIDEVRAILPAALDLAPIRHGSFERDGVALLTCVSARGLSFDAVLVPGLVEGLFPGTARPDPLLPDDERERLGMPLRAGPRQAREERFLFELALSAGRRRVVLLAARAEAVRGRERVLSPFLLEVLRPSPDDGVGPSVRSLGIGRVVHDGPPLDLAEAVRRATDRQPGALESLLAPFEPLSRALRRGRARRRPGFSAYEGNVGRASPLTDLCAAPLSASRLETLAGCPYRWFLSDVLGLSPREELERPLDAEASERGTFVHDVLRDLSAGGPLASLPGSEAVVRVGTVTARHVAEWAASGELDLPEALLARVEDEIVSAVLATLAFERGRKESYRTVGVEAPFDGVALGPFRFRGRIDRVDAVAVATGAVAVATGAVAVATGAVAGGPRVVDYKLGGAAPYEKTNRGRHLIARGERLQLPIYALAVGPSGVASEYLFVTRGEDEERHAVIPRAFDAEETGAAVEALRRFLEAAHELTGRGLLVPRTTSLRRADPCATCPVSPVCGPGHVRLYERKRAPGDPDLGPLTEIESLP